MVATLTTVDGILKEVYEGTIEDQLMNEVLTLRRIERSSEGVTSRAGGKYVDFPIRVRRNHGIGYRNENEALPAAGQQKYDDVHIPLRYGYGHLRMTGQLIELAEKDFQAFSSAMDEEIEGLTESVTKDSNRIVYGNAKGTLATVTADGVNTVTVASTKYLEVGMQIDIVNATTGTASIADRQITAINTTTGVVTYSGADGTAVANEILVRQGSFNREPNGFTSLITDTGALYDVDPAVEPVWAATVMGNAGTNRPLSEGLMIELVDTIEAKGGKVSVIFTSPGVRRAYFNLLTQQRRYNDTKEYAGGFQGLSFMHGRDIPVVTDHDAPLNTMWFVTEKSMKVYRDSPWRWMDRDGGRLKWVQGFDAYEAILFQYWEMGLRQRNANGKLADISEG